MRPPHPYVHAFNRRRSSRLAGLQAASPKPSSSSQIPQELSTVSVDLPPPHEAFSRHALKRLSLETSVRKPTSPKKANSPNLKQTQAALSKEKRHCAELEAVNQELSRQLIAVTATLAQELKCAICHVHMVAASTTPCGHTFCTDCLASWFRVQIRGKVQEHGYEYDLPINIILDDKYPRNAEDRKQLQSYLRVNMSFARAEEWFTYRCPTCQTGVSKTPYEVHAMKEIIGSFMTNIHPHLEDSVLGSAANVRAFAGLFVDGDL